MLKHDKLIIAESGGTKTSWYYRYPGVEVRLEGPSLKPQYWAEVNQRIPSAIRQLPLGEFHLCFYGSGFYRKVHHPLAEQTFLDWGMSSFQIKGDVEAAAEACDRSKQGYCAILGTGSVAIKYDADEVLELFGGHGAIDDFGSGSRFQHLRKEMDFKHLSDEELHSVNIEAFFKWVLLPSVPKQSVIDWVGSYAYFNRSIIQPFLKKYDYQMGQFIRHPMDKLIEKSKLRP